MRISRPAHRFIGFAQPIDNGVVNTAYSGDTGLKYLGDGNWQFNWKTLKTHVGCRTMTLTLRDGGTHTVQFRFI